MIVIPAIDIKNGHVVRLTQGKFDKETVYDPDPVSIAKKWAADGAKLLHIIDLDGAESGTLKNLDLIKKIIDQTHIAVQIGGGIRDHASIEKAIAVNVTRVILGTRAVEDLDFLGAALKKWEKKIAVSLDCADGFVTTKGWTKKTKIKALDLIPTLQKMGLRTLIFTDIATDGMLTGPNMESLKAVLGSAKMHVIASGGISKIDDIKALLALKAENLYGAITGKALYENKLNLKDAINLCLKNASSHA